MWIYKITNIQNGKIYIGQSIRPVKKRFQRHLTDALNKHIDTKFSRAIRKYGRNSFKYEIIDTALTQKELTEKEYYWISFYDSVKTGYNETDSFIKCGGNTYKNKTKEDLQSIKNKLSISKIGNKNPNARKVKKINIITGETEVFDTIISCAKSCGIKSGKTSIMKILSGKTTKPYKNTYMFEYYSDN